MKNKGLRILLALTLTFTTFLTSVSQGANFALFDSFAFNKVVPNDWNPRKLFLDGTQGCFFDPSDLTTVFQDAAGTIPGAVGSPVGLLLDKSQGLVRGNELTGGWTLGSNATIASGVITYNTSGGTLTTNSGGTLVTVGKVYDFTINVQSVSAGAIRLFPRGTALGTSRSNVGTYTERIAIPSGATGFVGIDPGGTFVGSFAVSVKEVLGNHASQSTSSAKPILRQDAGGRYYLEFDGVDDYLLTGFLTSQPNTLAAAFNNPASGATIEIVAGARSATADRFFIGAMTDQLQIGYGTPGAQGTAVSSIATHVTVLEGSATLVNGYVDSIVKVSLGASGTATAGCGLVLGALNNAGAINFYSSSRVYGVLALNKILPTSDRQKLERYMARKSGVTL